MSLREWIVVGVIVAELFGGAALGLWRWSQPKAPVADVSSTEPLAAAHLRRQAETCRTTADWAKLGESYLAYGYFTHAEACFRQASAWEPNNPALAFDLAFTLERLGRTSEANEQYRRAISLGHPSPADCRYFIGRNLLREEKEPEARAAFVEAGDHPAARYELARLLVRDGHLEEAAAEGDRLAAEYPKALQPWLLRARIEVLRGDAKAEARFADRADHTLDRLPTPFDAQSQRLMDAFDRMGAEHEWRACRDLLTAGKVAEAEPRLRDALEAQWDPVGADLLAEAELQNGRPREAFFLLNEVVEKAGPTAYSLTRLGDALEAGGQIDAAVKTWLRAVDLGTPEELKDLHYRLSMHFDQSRNPERARQHLALAYYGAGLLAFHRREWADARTTLEKAVETDPKSAQAWFYLGELHRAQGRPAEARAAYRRCLDVNPNHGRALAALDLLTDGPP